MSDVWLFWDLLLEFTKFSWIGKSMFPVLLASRYHHITSTFFMLSVSPPLLPGRVFWIPRWTWDIVISFPKMGHHLTKILWSYLGFNRLLNVKNDVNTLLCIIYWLNPHSCWLHHSYIPFFRLRSLFYQPLLLVPKSSFFWCWSVKRWIPMDSCWWNQRYLVNKLGLRVTVVPWDYDFTQEDFDGLFLSNGPGDPTQCAQTVENVKCLRMN